MFKFDKFDRNSDKISEVYGSQTEAKHMTKHTQQQKDIRLPGASITDTHTHMLAVPP